MPDSITIHPIAPFQVTLRPPGSKSLTNRALLLAALADGESVIRRPLIADDTQRMLQALQALGFGVETVDDGEAVRIAGTAGSIPAESADLHLGNAGTAMRSLAAACCLGRGTYRLDGIPRMRQRPIAELVDPLNRIGGDVRYLRETGFPPLEIHAHGLRGGDVEMRPTLSSQFITALAIVAPCCEHGLDIQFHGPITSRPYVDLTIGLMGRFGVHAGFTDDGQRLNIRSATYRSIDYTVEPDASNATYLLAAAAVVPGSSCTIEGLGRRSLQGDVGFATEVLARMGAKVTQTDEATTVTAPPAGQTLTGLDIDLNHMPDAAMTLATIAVLASGPTTIRGVANWRVKETDRMAAMHTELTRLGARVTIDDGDITIQPPKRLNPGVAIDTYDDHRMAMSFAILGLPRQSPGITINDPRCVDKTFPDFFGYLDRLRHARPQAVQGSA